jgi:hypothetical protein
MATFPQRRAGLRAPRSAIQRKAMIGQNVLDAKGVMNEREYSMKMYVLEIKLVNSFVSDMGNKNGGI